MRTQKSILIVEDDADNAEIYQQLFENEYLLALARDGLQALVALESHVPDLILLDVMMPGITGYEVCRRIRANPKTKHIKIIMVSASAMPSDQAAGMAAGADLYLTKPFRINELRQHVRSALAE